MTEDNQRGLAGRMVDSIVGPLVRPVVDAVEVDDLIERVDVNAVLGRVDVNAVLDRVDADRLLDRVDPDRLLDRVSPDRLLDRLDPDRLLDRIDVDRLMERIDIDRLMERVDVNALVKRTELGEIIARSTTGIFGQLLDVARTATMTIDLVVQGAVDKVVRHSGDGGQRRPDDPEARTHVRDLTRMERAVALQGHYSGSVSRFLAFLLDIFVSGAMYSLTLAFFSFALQVVTGVSATPSDHRALVITTYLGWQLIYFAVPVAVTGRTVGKAVLGLFVVRSSGTDVNLGHATLRALAFPLSFLLFGFGFLLGLLRSDRRELHDLIADTAVIYGWDAEVARLRARGSAAPR